LDEELPIDKATFDKIDNIFQSSEIWKIHFSQNKSFMSFLTKLQYKTKYFCENCKKKNTELDEEECAEFVLNLNTNKYFYNYSEIKELCKNNTITANCSFDKCCKIAQKHRETKVFTRLPPILILNFIYPINLYQINIDFERLELTQENGLQFSYRLYALTTSSSLAEKRNSSFMNCSFLGHSIAVCKNPKDQKIYRFNDESVSSAKFYNQSNIKLMFFHIDDESM